MHGRNSYTGMCRDSCDGSLFPRCCTGRVFVQEVPPSMNLVLIQLSAKLEVDPSLHSEVFKPARIMLGGIEALQLRPWGTHGTSYKKYGLLLPDKLSGSLSLFRIAKVPGVSMLILRREI